MINYCLPKQTFMKTTTHQVNHMMITKISYKV